MSEESERSRRRDAWWFGGATAAALALLARHLVVPDLNLAYPFIGGDGHDWIANGLALFGDAVRYSARPPLLPLLLGALDRLGALALFPLVQLGLFWLFLAVLFALVGERAGRRAAWAVGALALGSAGLLERALEVMAEIPTLLLLALATRRFLAAEVDPRAYRAAGAWAGASLLLQPVALLLIGPAALLLAGPRRAQLRQPLLWHGALAFLLPALLWAATKLALFGSAGDVGAVNWGLVRWQSGGLGRFAASGLAFFGWPVALLALAGLVAAWRRPHERALALFAGAWLACAALFFGLLYPGADRRFHAYSAIAVLLLAGRALAALAQRSRAAFALATALALPTSALPAGESPTQILLWPLPARALEPFAARGGWEITAPPLAKLAVRTPLARALAASRSRSDFVPIDSAAFHGDEAALLLYPGGERPRDPYREPLRLGNALRLRVRAVSDALWSDEWLRRGAWQPLAPGDRFALFRVRLPGLARSWIVAAERESAPARRLASLPYPSLLLPSSDRSEPLRDAQRLADRIHPRDALLVIARSPGGDPEWLRLLPFVARTADFVLLDPEEANAVRPTLRCDGASQRLESSWFLTDCRWRGRRLTFVEERAASPTPP